MTVTVYEQPEGVGLESLEDALTGAFETLRGALARGEVAVVSLDDRDLAGHGEPTAAALAHGLVGLVRALALEGRKPGWQIAALACAPGVAAAERERWIGHLAQGGAASGALIRLGGEHLGRAPV